MPSILGSTFLGPSSCSTGSYGTEIAKPMPVDAAFMLNEPDSARANSEKDERQDLMKPITVTSTVQAGRNQEDPIRKQQVTHDVAMSGNIGHAWAHDATQRNALRLDAQHEGNQDPISQFLPVVRLRAAQSSDLSRRYCFMKCLLSLEGNKK